MFILMRSPLYLGCDDAVTTGPGPARPPVRRCGGSPRVGGVVPSRALRALVPAPVWCRAASWCRVAPPLGAAPLPPVPAPLPVPAPVWCRRARPRVPPFARRPGSSLPLAPPWGPFVSGAEFTIVIMGVYNCNHGCLHLYSGVYICIRGGAPIKYYGGFPPGPMGPALLCLVCCGARRGPPFGDLRLRSPSDDWKRRVAHHPPPSSLLACRAYSPSFLFFWLTHTINITIALL